MVPSGNGGNGGKGGNSGKPDRPASSPLEGRPRPLVTQKIAAEAAAWIACLHGPKRTPEMDTQFREWVSRSEAHGYAFERCSDIWTDVKALTPEQIQAGIAMRDLKAALARERWWHRFRWPLLSLLVLSIAAAGYGVQRWLVVDRYSTGVGGQQQVLLADGTRMSLNTDTRVSVELGSARRWVTLAAGEVMFEVAKDPLRPFVVRAGDSEVIAVGTVFSVRVAGSGSSSDSDRPLAVALVEGAVVVRTGFAAQADGALQTQSITMQPGERLRLAKATGESAALVVPQVDRPAPEGLLAWKRGEAVFIDTSLGDAVNEMNRYTLTPIVLPAGAAAFRLSGTFKTGDTQGFAQAVAHLHGLQLRGHDGRLVLSVPQ